jgi:tellurite resistance protein TehA-like permease
MHLLQFLRNFNFLTTIFINMMVIIFAFPAYRRTRMLAFALLILGAAIGVVLECGYKLHLAMPYDGSDNAVTFWLFYRAGYTIASISWGVGTYQLIKFVMSKFEEKEKKDA